MTEFSYRVDNVLWHAPFGRDVGTRFDDIEAIQMLCHPDREAFAGVELGEYSHAFRREAKALKSEFDRLLPDQFPKTRTPNYQAIAEAGRDRVWVRGFSASSVFAAVNLFFHTACGKRLQA